MSGFDQTLVAVIISFIIYFLSPTDHPKQLRASAAVFVVCIVTLLAVAWYAGWETIVPLPQRTPPVTDEPNPHPPEEPKGENPPRPTISQRLKEILNDLTNALNILKQWIDNLIAQVLIYGIIIAIMFRMIKSIFR